LKTFVVGLIVVIILLVVGTLYSLSTFDKTTLTPEEIIIMSNPEIKANNSCEIVDYCGFMVAVDCGAAVDGPLYYVDKDSGEILEYCGGFCERIGEEYCRECPPKEWNC